MFDHKRIVLVLLALVLAGGIWSGGQPIVPWMKISQQEPTEILAARYPLRTRTAGFFQRTAVSRVRGR